MDFENYNPNMVWDYHKAWREANDKYGIIQFDDLISSIKRYYPCAEQKIEDISQCKHCQPIIHDCYTTKRFATELVEALERAKQLAKEVYDLKEEK